MQKRTKQFRTASKQSRVGAPAPTRNKRGRRQKNKQSNGKMYAPLAQSSVTTTPSNAINPVIAHCEYVTDVIADASAGAFSQVQYQINPGNTGLFPWGSIPMSAFEEAELVRMQVRIRSLCSANTDGLAMVNCQYDSYDPAFGDKASMQNYSGTVATNVWRDLTFDIDVKTVRDRQKTYYVLPADESPSGDAREYFVGNLNIATSGCASNKVVGELWVEYAWRMKKPLVSSLAAPPTSETEAKAAVPGDISLDGSAALGPNAPIVWDLNSPFEFTSNSNFTYLQSKGTAANLGEILPYKWLLSLGGTGAYESKDSFSAGFDLAAYQANSIWNALDFDSAVGIDTGGANWFNVRHWLADFSKVTSADFRTNAMAAFASPTKSGSGGSDCTFASALLSRISEKAYNSMFPPASAGRAKKFQVADFPDLLSHRRLLSAHLKTDLVNSATAVCRPHSALAIERTRGVPVTSTIGPVERKLERPCGDEKAAVPSDFEYELLPLERVQPAYFQRAPPLSRPNTPVMVRRDTRLTPAKAESLKA